MSLTILMLSAAVLAGTGAPVAADGSSGAATPYDIRPVPHAVLTASTWGFLLIYERLVLSELDGGLSCSVPQGRTRCDPKELNALDRTVVGKKSNRLLLASDIISGVLFLGAAVGTAVDAHLADTTSPAADALTDAVVIAEATGAAVLLAHLFKAAVRRPRPTAYAEVGSVSTVQHQLSFPSGHTAAVTSTAAAWTTTYWLRHPDDAMRWGVLGASAVLCTAVAATRVQGGFHFPTDVMAGALIGAGLGVSIPLLLQREVTIAPALMPEGAALRVQWGF